VHSTCKLDMFMSDTCLLYHPEDGDLLLKHVGRLMCIDDSWFYIIFVQSLLYVVVYSHNTRHKCFWIWCGF